jgi:hypothetical protein
VCEDIVGLYCRDGREQFLLDGCRWLFVASWCLPFLVSQLQPDFHIQDDFRQLQRTNFFLFTGSIRQLPHRRCQHWGQFVVAAASIPADSPHPQQAHLYSQTCFDSSLDPPDDVLPERFVPDEPLPELCSFDLLLMIEIEG